MNKRVEVFGGSRKTAHWADFASISQEAQTTTQENNNARLRFPENLKKGFTWVTWAVRKLLCFFDPSDSLLWGLLDVILAEADLEGAASPKGFFLCTGVVGVCLGPFIAINNLGGTLHKRMIARPTSCKSHHFPEKQRPQTSRVIANYIGPLDDQCWSTHKSNECSRMFKSPKLQCLQEQQGYKSGTIPDHSQVQQYHNCPQTPQTHPRTIKAPSNAARNTDKTMDKKYKHHPHRKQPKTP